MRWLRRQIRRLLLAAGVLVLALLAPVAWVELSCRGTPLAEDRTPLLPAEHRRAESRTLMTYPEWHIVHAYDDYATVISSGDPHDFDYFHAIRGYWSSLCDLMRASAEHGGVDGPTRQMVHVIGVSFTAELLAKAAYEETAGRLATWVRGPVRAPLDDLSAAQARAYATFLRQTPWYRWDFAADAAALRSAATGAPRDRERAFALGLEYGAKALYARAIGAAVAATGFDELTMRSIVFGLTTESLAAIPGVTVIGPRPGGIEIETPRYRAFTLLAGEIARAGGEFVEIAGNDDILFTQILPEGRTAPGALAAFPRQGNPGVRVLRLVKVGELSAILRGPEGALVEHVHDY